MAKTPHTGSAHGQKRTASAGAHIPSSPVDLSVYSNMFVGTVLGMSWQLALVVIVPIVGGHFLDQRFMTDPLLTLIGLVVALGGAWVVLWRVVREANSRVAQLGPKDNKK